MFIESGGFGFFVSAHLQDAQGFGEAFDHFVAGVGVFDAPHHGLGYPVPRRHTGGKETQNGM